jgi:hypothetical protein
VLLARVSPTIKSVSKGANIIAVLKEIPCSWKVVDATLTRSTINPPINTIINKKTNIPERWFLILNLIITNMLMGIISKLLHKAEA